MVCAILKGDLPIEITWALNGEPIRPDRSDINILATTRKNSILSIESVAARHAGEYTCSASNKAGATSYSAILAVNGTSRPRDFLCICPPHPIIVYYPLLIVLSSSSPEIVVDGQSRSSRHCHTLRYCKDVYYYTHGCQYYGNSQ